MVFDALTLGAASEEIAEKRLIDYAQNTRPQRLWMSETAPIALWRDGNALGKSTAAAIMIHDAARGVARFAPIVRKPPVSILVLGISWSQMEPLADKIWAYAPKDELDPRNGFEPGMFITGKPPRLKYVSGPGKKTVIHFATYGQGAGRIAGSQHDYVFTDEPLPESIYGELRPRLIRRKGRLRMNFTPTLSSPTDVQYLRKFIADGKIVEHNYTLREENTWLEGAPSPYMTQLEIDTMASELILAERNMRLGLSWDPITEGRWIDGFDDYTNMYAEGGPEKDGATFFGIGMDHGVAPNKQKATLIAVRQPYGHTPLVHYMDAVDVPGSLSEEMFAELILAVLERNGLKYDDISTWVGDRAISSKKAGGVIKSNARVRTALALILKRQLWQTQPIATPNKFSGSVMWGCQVMNALFLHNLAYVNRPHCPGLREAILSFAGDPHAPCKDILDSARYITEKMVQPGKWMASLPTRG